MLAALLEAYGRDCTEIHFVEDRYDTLLQVAACPGLDNVALYLVGKSEKAVNCGCLCTMLVSQRKLCLCVLHSEKERETTQTNIALFLELYIQS